jgi:hypothetical protein
MSGHLPAASCAGRKVWSSRRSQLLDDVAVDRVGIEQPVELIGDVVFDGTEEGTGGIGADPKFRKELQRPAQQARRRVLG